MKIFFSLVILFSVLSAHAQEAAKGNGKITGIIMDSSTGKPVEFATVALTLPGSDKPIDGAVCDEKGKFTISKVPYATYQLVIQFIGYENLVVPSVVISAAKSSVDIGSIKFKSESQELETVVVEGQRALVEEKVDRTIYNAENDQTAKGGDATDVLKRVPLLSVDMDGNVSLRGNSNIKVLINNKPSTISASSVADALKQIPADQIKTVEVITSPSAKYDAEGSAGIINIILKKNNLEGFSLNVDGSAGYRGSNLSLNGSYRKGKMGFSLGGFGRAGYNVNGSFVNDQTLYSVDGAGNRTFQSQTIQSASTRNQNLFGNYQAGWDYDIDKNNSLTASIRYGARNGETFQDGLLTQTLTPTRDTTTLRNVQTLDNSGTIDASLNYTHLFAKPQQEFSLLALYSRNDRTNDFFNINLNESNLSIANRLKNINSSFNQEVTIQADYQTPIGTTQLIEFGGKNISRKVSSDFSYLSAPGANGEFTPVPATGGNLANIFNYNQNITAAYVSYTLSMKSGYSLKAGSRYEYTTINANFASEKGPITIPSYGVLVPSINLSKRFGNGTTLKLAYNRRIQRPSIQFLNPNLQASNPTSVSQGNPLLAPEYTNNYELSYSTFIGGTTLNFSTFVRNTSDAIQSVKIPIQDSPASVLANDSTYSQAIYTSYQNIGSENAYGGSVFANVNISDKFTVSGGTDVYYSVLKNNAVIALYDASNSGWVANFRIFGNYKLQKGWGIQFFSFYRSPQVQLQGTQGNFYVYSLGFKKDISKKGSIGFGAEQFFTPSLRINNVTSSPLIDQRSTNELRNMNFKVTFSYRIGKMTIDGARRRKKSINNDDLKDGGDGGGGGADMQGAGGGGGAPRTGGGQGAAVAAVVPTKPADLTAVVKAEGNWKYTIESPQGGNGTLTIKKEGDAYTGVIINSRNNRETPLTNVKLVGNELSFGYDVSFGGNTATITTKVIIESDSMSGAMTIGQFGSFPIKATRQP
ncbi:outer membrane beta-barrel family protein [soil metagenome]